MTDLADAGFVEAGEVTRRFGRLAFLEREDPAAFWVRAHGFVTPTLLRADLERAEGFGRAHPGGWVYVADTSGVRAVHPWNVVLLRCIRRLPNLRAYVVVAPALATRLLIASGRALVRPDHVAKSVEDGLAAATAGLSSEYTPADG